MICDLILFSRWLARSYLQFSVSKFVDLVKRSRYFCYVHLFSSSEVTENNFFRVGSDIYRWGTSSWVYWSNRWTIWTIVAWEKSPNLASPHRETNKERKKTRIGLTSLRERARLPDCQTILRKIARRCVINVAIDQIKLNRWNTYGLNSGKFFLDSKCANKWNWIVFRYRGKLCQNFKE